MKDLKEALGSARKADVTHVRSGIKRYIARACEYGSAKYERGNYLRPAAAGAKRGGTQAPELVRADFNRLRAYLRAAASHIDATLDAMELHLAEDPQLLDVEGMRRAAYAEDTDAKPGCRVGASGLPHVAHAAASLMMAIEQATVYGLLPDDPGEPWALRAVVAAMPEEPSEFVCEPDIGTEVADEREQMYLRMSGDRPVSKPLKAYADEVAAEFEPPASPDDELIVMRWRDGACGLCGGDRGDRYYTCEPCCDSGCSTGEFSRASRVIEAWARAAELDERAKASSEFLDREPAPKHTVVGLGDQVADPEPWSVLSGGRS